MTLFILLALWQYTMCNVIAANLITFFCIQNKYTYFAVLSSCKYSTGGSFFFSIPASGLPLMYSERVRWITLQITPHNSESLHVLLLHYYNIFHEGIQTPLYDYHYDTIHLNDNIGTTRQERRENIGGGEFSVQDSTIHPCRKPPPFSWFLIMDTEIWKAVTGHFCPIHHKTERFFKLNRSLDPIMVSSSVHFHLSNRAVNRNTF
jgi:hypothetical protein